MERQPRHSRVSHFPGVSSGLAGLRLLSGHCSPGADLDTHVVAAQLRAHTDREVKVPEGAVDEEPHTRVPSPLHCLQLLQGTSEQGPASRGTFPNTPPPPPSPLTQPPTPPPPTTRPIDTAPGIFRISWWQGWGVTLSQDTLGCLHPVVRDGGAILFQPCDWFPFSSHETYIIFT